MTSGEKVSWDAVWSGFLRSRPWGKSVCEKSWLRKFSGKTGKGGGRKWEWERKEARPGWASGKASPTRVSCWAGSAAHRRSGGQRARGGDAGTAGTASEEPTVCFPMPSWVTTTWEYLHHGDWQMLRSRTSFGNHLPVPRDLWQCLVRTHPEDGSEGLLCGRRNSKHLCAHQLRQSSWESHGENSMCNIPVYERGDSRWSVKDKSACSWERSRSQSREASESMLRHRQCSTMQKHAGLHCMENTSLDDEKAYMWRSLQHDLPLQNIGNTKMPTPRRSSWMNWPVYTVEADTGVKRSGKVWPGVTWDDIQRATLQEETAWKPDVQCALFCI